MMLKNVRVAIGLMALLGLLCLNLALNPALAWFWKKPAPEPDPEKQVQTFQPPPKTAMEEYCEPYRHEAALRSSVPFLVKPAHWPRRLWLMKAYRKCTHELMSQEYNYLKHADIELAPSLPKLKPKVEPITQPGEPKGDSKNATW